MKPVHEQAIAFVCGPMFLLMLFFAFPADAAEVWTDLGLYGGRVETIAIDPTNPDKMFAGTYQGDGLYRTDDGGGSWRAVEMDTEIPHEDTFKNHVVMKVCMAPGDSRVVWAVHNYWAAKSTDGGETWGHIQNERMQRLSANSGGTGDDFRYCRALAIDPIAPQTIYVGAGGANSAFSGGAVYKTTNGGISWAKLNQGENFDFSVTDVAVDPQDRMVVWAVTSSFGSGGWGGTLYRSGDGGQNWEVVYNINSGFTAVSVKPDDSNSVFTCSGYGVMRHCFENSEWQTPVNVIPGCWLAEDLAFSPTDPQVVYAVWSVPTSWGGDGLPKISQSDDGGETWNTHVVGITPSGLVTIAVHPLDSETVFAGDNSLAVVTSSDAGQSWKAVSSGINANTIYDVATDPADTSHLLAATQSGVYERSGPGSAWTRLTMGTTFVVVFHPSDQLTYYAGMTGYLMKTMDGGAMWAYSAQLEANGIVQDIAVDDSVDPNILFAATKGYGALNGKLYRSTDNGDTFSEVLVGENQAGDPCDFNTVAIDPSDREHMLAGSGNFYNDLTPGDLWESRDGGINWDRASLENMVVKVVRFHPNDPNIIYAGCGHSGGACNALYKSTDGGATWNPAAMPGYVVAQRHIWGVPSGEIFISGRSNPCYDFNIQRCSGSDWTAMETPISADLLSGIWGTAPDNLFAVGNSGVILHFDGSAWTQMESHTTEDLFDVWGFSSSDVYATGRNGTFLHFDGNAWSLASQPFGLYRMWGPDADNLFVIGGDPGKIWHYSGGSFREMDTGADRYLEDIWGTSSADIFAVGDDGVIVHYDGTTWYIMRAADAANRNLEAIWGSSESDVFVVGSLATIFHFDGISWSEVDTGLNINQKEYFSDVWGSSSADVYVMGEWGTVLHYDGQCWKVHKTGGRVQNAVTDIAFHRQDSEIVYAATQNAGVYLSPNQGENWLNLGEPEYDVYAISTGSLYAATQGGLYQCTGTGVVAGRVADAASDLSINSATVLTDLGLRCFTIDGDYMLVSPAGIFELMAWQEGYEAQSKDDVTVYGADVTRVDFALEQEDPAEAPQEAPELDAPTGISVVDGGRYCFVGILTDGGMKSGVGTAGGGLVGAVLALILCFFFRRISQKTTLMIIAMVFFCSDGASAATIFQQAGIASALSPVGSGARAMGMGGAFIAVADDATAASWNPAGLIQLEKSEVSVVGAYVARWEEMTSDAQPEVNNKDYVTDLNLNYFSAAYPFHFGKNMVVSLNYQRLYDFNRNFRYTQQSPSRRVAFEQEGFLGALGLAAAVEITPRISLGATLNIWTDELLWENGWTENYRARYTDPNTGATVSDVRMRDDYSEFRGINANVGVLWSPSDSFSLGAVFKTPFKATMKHEFSYNDVVQSNTVFFREDVALYMPLSYGVGCAYRFSDAASVDVDLYRTHWSDYVLKNSQGVKFSPIDGRLSPLSDVEDTIHIRLGGEYLFIMKEKMRILSLRGGVFLDQEPSEGDAKNFFGAAVGTGISFKRFMLDAAYQYRWADNVDNGNLIATSKADVQQHQILCSLIVFL